MKKFMFDGESSARVIDVVSLEMAQESFELVNYV